MIDERQGKLSGSGMAGYAACAGKFNLEKQTPKGPSNPAADLGTRVHQYIASGGKITLPPEEVEIADLIVEKYEEAMATIALGAPEQSVIESRLWYGQLWSGQIDRIDFFGKTKNVAVVTDYKSGRIPQGAAAENLQLRAYAVLTKKAYPQLQKIYVSIVQPLAGPTSIAEYGEEELRLADAEISDIVAKALQPDAPRTPSPDACKYCKGKSVCPEAQAEYSAMSKYSVAEVRSLTNDQLSQYLSRAEIVEDIIAALRVEAKSRLLAGAAVAGYRLANGNSNRSIPKPDLALLKLSGIITKEEFAQCCKVSAPQLEQLVAKNLQLKAKEAKQKLADLLGEALSVKQGEQKMVRD